MSDLRTKLMQGARAGSSGGSMKKADSVVAVAARDSLPPRSLKVSLRDSMLPLYQFCPLKIQLVRSLYLVMSIGNLAIFIL